MPAQAAIEAGTRDVRVQELAHNCKKIVERQEQNLRNSTAIVSCAGVSVVCSRCGVWLRSWTLSRLRHFQIVCSEIP